MELADNVLVWAKGWLAKGTPRFGGFGIVRLVEEMWAVPGRMKLTGDGLIRAWLNPEHPRARDVVTGAVPDLARGPNRGALGLTMRFVGEILAAGRGLRCQRPHPDHSAKSPLHLQEGSG